MIYGHSPVAHNENGSPEKFGATGSKQAPQGPPQSMPVSFWFCMPSLQLAVAALLDGSSFLQKLSTMAMTTMRESAVNVLLVFIISGFFLLKKLCCNICFFTGCQAKPMIDLNSVKSMYYVWVLPGERRKNCC